MNKMILKRDGSLVPFNLDKIAIAIEKAFKACGYQKEVEDKVPYALAQKVLDYLESRDTGIPTVEFVQDIVEEVLIKDNYMRGAKAYILYRDKRNIQRKVSASLVGSFEELNLYRPKNNYFNSPKVKAQIFGEISLKKYYESTSFDCFMAKSLEEGILIIDNLPYLNNAIYQYVIDAAKIKGDNVEFAFNKLFELILLFSRYQVGNLKIVNFDKFIANLPQYSTEQLENQIAIISGNLNLMCRSSVVVSNDNVAENISALFLEPFVFSDDVTAENTVFNITVDYKLLRIKSDDFGIDYEGLEARIISFLNESSQNLFKDCLNSVSDYQQYLASESFHNQINVINLSRTIELESVFPHFVSTDKFEDKIIIKE